MVHGTLYVYITEQNPIPFRGTESGCEGRTDDRGSRVIRRRRRWSFYGLDTLKTNEVRK